MLARALNSMPSKRITASIASTSSELCVRKDMLVTGSYVELPSSMPKGTQSEDAFFTVCASNDLEKVSPAPHSQLEARWQSAWGGDRNGVLDDGMPYSKLLAMPCQAAAPRRALIACTL